MILGRDARSPGRRDERNDSGFRLRIGHVGSMTRPGLRPTGPSATPWPSYRQRGAMIAVVHSCVQAERGTCNDWISSGVRRFGRGLGCGGGPYRAGESGLGPSLAPRLGPLAPLARLLGLGAAAGPLLPAATGLLRSATGPLRAAAASLRNLHPVASRPVLHPQGTMPEVASQSRPNRREPAAEALWSKALRRPVPGHPLRRSLGGVGDRAQAADQPAGLIRRERSRRLGLDVLLEAADGSAGQRAEDAVHRSFVITRATERFLNLPSFCVRHGGFVGHRGRCRG